MRVKTISRVEEMMASGQILPIRFPDPGKPEGVRTFRKPIMTLKDIAFQYEGAEKRILEKANATVTLGSRAVLLGANGAGKSTFLKLIVVRAHAHQPGPARATRHGG